MTYIAMNQRLKYRTNTQTKSKSHQLKNLGLVLLYTISLLVPIGGLIGLYDYYQKQLDDISEARIILFLNKTCDCVCTIIREIN